MGSAVTSNNDVYFRIGNKWFESNECKETECLELENVVVAIYDRTNLPNCKTSETYAYKGEDLVKIKQKQDRHIPTEKRKEDRDKDRHLNPGKDRHLPTEKRKEDRHLQ